MYPGKIFKSAPSGIVNLWYEVAKRKCIYGGVANAIQIIERNVYEEIRMAELEEAMVLAKKLVEEVCTGCRGDHNVWWLCGGAAAFWSKKTNSYGDYDYFVQCEGFFKKVKSFQGNKVKQYRMLDGKVSVMNLIDKFFKVQVIPVAFICDQPSDLSAFQDFFALYVIANFDLPICRVGLHFTITPPTETEPRKLIGKIVDASFINRIDTDVSRCRVEKYRARTCNEPVSVGKLSVMFIFCKLHDMVREV